MNISDLVYRLTNIDINHSDCGRKLKGFDTKLVRFYLTPSNTLTAKIIKVAGILGAIPCVAGTIGLEVLAIRVALFSSAHSCSLTRIKEVVGVVALIILGVVGVKWILNCYKEYSIQKQEKRLVDQLGGKQAYESLPKLSAERINIIHEVNESDLFYPRSLDRIKPVDVNQKPITVGVDAWNRPFISVCVIKKNDLTSSDPVVDTFFQRHYPPNPYGRRAGDKNTVFPDEIGFDDFLLVLKQLQDNTHQTYQLVESSS